MTAIEVTPADATSPPGRADRLASAAFVLGGSLIVLVTAGAAAGALGWLVGVSTGAWIAGPAVVAQGAFAYGAWRADDPGRALVAAMAIVLAGWTLVAAAGLVASEIADTAVDGRHYQSESVWALHSGWNPVWDEPLVWPPGNPALWTNSYPKAVWVLEAATLQITDIEAAKWVGPVLIMAAGLLAFAGLSKLGIGRWASIAGGIALALNPVASAQLMTHMVDGIRSSVMLSVIMLAVLLVDRPWRLAPFIAFAAALALLINVKFTGPVFVALLLAVLVIVGLRRYGARAVLRPVLVLAAVYVVAVVVIGFDPYVTNTVRYHSPLHPVIGPQAIDIAGVHTGRALRDRSDWERLAVSLTSRTSASGVYADPKLPFTASAAEWEAFEFPNVRIGGFGPFFSGVCVLALVAGVGLLVMRLRRGRSPTPAARLLLTFALVLLLSTLVLPDAFLARFAPHIWFVPLLVLVVGLQPGVGRVVRIVAWCGLLLALVNAVSIAVVAGRLDVRASRQQEASLTRLAANRAGYDAEFGRWVLAESRRLRDAGVDFRPVPRGSLAGCPRPLGLTFDGRLVRVVRSRREGRGQLFRGVILCRRVQSAGSNSPSSSSAPSSIRP